MIEWLTGIHWTESPLLEVEVAAAALAAVVLLGWIGRYSLLLAASVFVMLDGFVWGYLDHIAALVLLVPAVAAVATRLYRQEREA